MYNITIHIRPFPNVIFSRAQVGVQLWTTWKPFLKTPGGTTAQKCVMKKKETLADLPGKNEEMLI